MTPPGLQVPEAGSYTSAIGRGPSLLNPPHHEHPPVEQRRGRMEHTRQGHGACRAPGARDRVVHLRRCHVSAAFLVPHEEHLPPGSRAAVCSSRCETMAPVALQVPEAGHTPPPSRESRQTRPVLPRRAPCRRQQRRRVAVACRGHGACRAPGARGRVVHLRPSRRSRSRFLPRRAPCRPAAAWPCGPGDPRPWSLSHSRCPRPGRTPPPSRRIQGCCHWSPPRRAPARRAAASPCGSCEARPGGLSRSRCPRPGRTPPPPRGTR
jgi:hypothetical protein